MSDKTTIALIDWGEQRPVDVYGLPALAYLLRALARAGVGQAVVVGPPVDLPAQQTSVVFVAAAADAATILRPAQRILLSASPKVSRIRFLDEMVATAANRVLVFENMEATHAFELIDAKHRWAGWLSLDTAAVLDVLTELPDEWSGSSTLLRRAIQDGAGRIVLPLDDLAPGAPIDDEGVRDVPRQWIVQDPLQRLAGHLVRLPVVHELPDIGLIAFVNLLFAAACLLASYGLPTVAALLFAFGLIGAETWTELDIVRLAPRPTRARSTSWVYATAVLLAVAGRATMEGGQWGVALFALFVVFAVGLTCRLVPSRQPPLASDAIILLSFAAIGHVDFGLGAIASLAAVRLGCAIERLHRKG